MPDKQCARLNDGEGLQDPVPEYYFSEKGEDCFSRGKAVHIQEYACTIMGTLVPGRTANLLIVCLHVLSLAIIKYT